MSENRFKKIKSIGYGGTSQVFLAEDKKTGRRLALKQIHSHLAQNPEIKDKLKQEIAITRQLRHPGIIQIYEMYEEEDFLSVSMEYLSGGDLKSKILLSKGLPLSETSRILLPVLSALEKAHRNGFIHGDIKPHNILFDENDNPKLADFGLAHNADTAEPMAQAGTAEYCPPEIIQGISPDSRSDLYSMGIVLFEAITGQLPFSGNSPWQILQKQINQKPPKPSEINPSLPKSIDLIVAKAMEKDPGLRFQTAEEFKNALETSIIPAIPASVYKCPECGQPMVEELGICLFCNPSPLILSRADKKDPSYKLVVCGPGKAGDKVKDHTRFKLLEILEKAGLESKSLKKTGLRFPFTLVKGLSHISAESLSDALSKIGLESLILGPGLKKEKQQYRILLKDRVKALAPRIMLVILGMSYGWINMFNSFKENAPLLITGWILLFILVPLITSLAGALTSSTKKLSSNKSPETLHLLESIYTLSQKKQYSRLVGRSLYLIEIIKKNTNIPKKDKKDIIPLIVQLTDECARTMSAIEFLQEEKKILVKPMPVKNSHQKDSPYMDSSNREQHTEKLKDRPSDNRKITEINKKLKERRILSLQIEQLNSQIIRATSGLDALTLDLLGLKQTESKFLLSRLEEMEQELKTTKDSLKEVDAI